MILLEEVSPRAFVSVIPSYPVTNPKTPSIVVSSSVISDFVLILTLFVVIPVLGFKIVQKVVPSGGL